MSTAKASTLIELGRHAEALHALDGLGEEGLTAYAHCLRARAYLGLNKLTDAERAAASARAAAPDHEWGYRLGAIVARKQMRPRLADERAGEAVRLAPHEPNCHQVCTLTALDLGDVPRALQHSAEMLRLAPHDALSHYTRGLAYAADKRPGPAEEEFRQALSINPQDAASMSALADLVAAQDPAQAKELRLSAVRISPQVRHHRRQLLNRGGAVGGGTVFALAKLGIFGKIFAIGAIDSLAGVLGFAVVGGLLLAGYLLAFAVTRFRRWRHGKGLPPLVWEGLKAERRNADLLWIAWPSGLVFVGASFGASLQLAFGRLPVGLLLAALIGAGLLAMCWQLRRGAARELAISDLARKAASTGRYVWQRRRASRRRAKLPVRPRTW